MEVFWEEPLKFETIQEAAIFGGPLERKNMQEETMQGRTLSKRNVLILKMRN